MSLAIVNARIVTMAGAGVDAESRLGVVQGSVRIEGDRIVEVREGGGGAAGAERVLDARGRVVMPGMVDCHTHACWAGNRLDEWELRRRGAGYLEILKAGGGIMSTVRAVRAASDAELVERLLERLGAMLAAGTTTVEVKSGYGLTPGDELRMLRVIRAAAGRFAGTVVATGLLGHAMDPDQVAQRGEDGYVDWMIREALPAVTAEFPGIAIDAYCEQGAWTVDQCARLFEAARASGHPVRVHADQFNSLGMVGRAIGLGARSVDHLEASTDADIAALGAGRNAAGGGPFAVLLPICGLHMDDRYARGRALAEACGAGRVAVATNLNPGSAPSGSMALAIGLAVRKCGLPPAEAIAAATVNAAGVLGLGDRGRVAPGMRADLVVLRHEDERELAYSMGHGAIGAVICGGRVVHVAVDPGERMSA